MRAPILALILASIPTLAAAQDAPPAPTAPPAAMFAPPPVGVAAPAAEPLRPGLDPGQVEDPNIDRTLLMPTAQTQPKGSFSFNDYELLLVGVTYGVTDDFQIGAMTLVPITDDMPAYLNASAKYRFVKAGPLRLAAQVGINYMSADFFDEGDDFDNGEGSDDDSLSMFSGGLIASICLDAGCHSLASASVTSATGFENDARGTALVFDASLAARVSPHAKLLLEVTSAGAFDGNDSLEVADGALLSYGVRFYSKEIAGDIGFIKPIGEDIDSDDFLLGIPFINFTYRQ